MNAVTNFILIFLFTIGVNSQIHEEGLSQIENKLIITENCILPNSKHNINAQQMGVLLKSFEVETIQGDFIEPLETCKIKRVEFEKNSCFIEFIDIGYEAYQFLAEIEVNHEVLILHYHGFGNSCFGNVNYKFKYEISKDFSFSEAMSIKYIMLAGKPETKIELSKILTN